MKGALAAIAVSCALAVVPRPAAADKGDKGDKGDKATPWATGVPKANQAKALELFKSGNAYFEEAKYTDALAEYEKAIPLWDHPNIEFNLAICLFNIRQPLEAWDHLEKAMKYGEAPLGKRLFDEAQTYKNLLESSLAQLEVANDDDDVQVMLDGKELFTGRAKKTVRLMAGAHELVASREGYDTETRALDLPAGKVTHEDVDLHPTKVKVKVKKIRENYERRWAWWVPWSVAGASVAVALAGTGTYLVGRSDMHAYDTALAAHCPMGCTRDMITPELAAQEAHAQHVGAAGIGLWGAGAAVGVAAGVMAILNRPKMLEGHPEASVVITPNYVGAGVALTFR